MKVNDNLKAVTNIACHRSIFDWAAICRLSEKETET